MTFAAEQAHEGLVRDGSQEFMPLSRALATRAFAKFHRMGAVELTHRPRFTFVGERPWGMQERAYTSPPK